MLQFHDTPASRKNSRARAVCEAPRSLQTQAARSLEARLCVAYLALAWPKLKSLVETQSDLFPPTDTTSFLDGDSQTWYNEPEFTPSGRIALDLKPAVLPDLEIGLDSNY